MLPVANNYVQDGASSNDREQGGSMNVQGLESVAEVRMETSGGSAKYSSPVSVIVTTKTGSNRLRFAVHETARNNAFGVARARQDVNLSGAPYQTPKLIRNEFGGSVGGPVFLPSFGLNGKRFYDGRNRTFFFFSREGLELRQGATRDFKVATEAMRRGDFSGLIDAQGRAITIYDPLTTQMQTVNGRPVAVRLPFANNQIPIGRQSPVAKYVWASRGLRATSPTPWSPPISGSPSRSNRQPNTSNNPTTLRIDHSAGNNDNLFCESQPGHALRGVRGTGRPDRRAHPRQRSQRPLWRVRREGGGSQLDSHLLARILRRDGRQPQLDARALDGPAPSSGTGPTFLGLPNPLGDTGWPGMTGLDFPTTSSPMASAGW